MASDKSLFAFNIKVFKICANVHLNDEMGILSTFIVYFSLLLTLLHELTLVADLVFYATGDFQRLCEDAPMAMAFFMVTYEFYNIVVQKDKIETLLYNIETTIELYQPTYGKDTYKKSQMGKFVDNLDKLGLYNLLFGIVCVELWVIRPVITNSGKLPFGNPWFPFNYQNYYYYLLLGQAYVGTCGTINTINIHIFYSKVMAVISEQFDVLSHAFKNIDEDIDSKGQCKDEEVIFRRTTCLIKYHQKILKCCQELQDCMGGILVCQFCFGISLCFAALATFSMTAFSATFINLLNHIFLEISELFIYCWFANKLTEYAGKIREGIFYSRWYMHSQKTKQLLRFVIMRCNKPVVIRAANVLPVSVGSYIWILQQSYSYFMVLRQVRGKISK